MVPLSSKSAENSAAEAIPPPKLTAATHDSTATDPGQITLISPESTSVTISINSTTEVCHSKNRSRRMR